MDIREFTAKKLRMDDIENQQDQRQCGAATIANHISSLLYPIKFLHREDGPGFTTVKIIQQLRAQATIFQKEGDFQRPSTREELEAQNRWLPWEEVVRAVSVQRERFLSAVQMNVKARECCDLVILSLYVFIPPSRGLEIRTLKIVSEPGSITELRGCNALVIRDDGVVLQFNDYKTKKSSGKDELTLKNDHELCKILLQFINDFRPRLTRESSANYLLLNKNGERYSGPAFSAHMKSLFRSLTGKLVTVNMLRSAFITWSYGRTDCTDALKTSLAAALRHSREQAQRTYDRRTANDKKQLAVSLARQFAEDQFEQDPDDVCSDQEREETEQPFQPGDFVAVVEKDSTLNKPKILIGQIHSFVGSADVSLLWYKDTSSGLYKLELTGDQWIEGQDSLVPVTLKAAKNRPGVYRLGTSPRQIHRAVMEK